MAPLAVDENQQVVRRQAPQSGGSHQGRLVVDAVALDVVGRGQGAQDVVHVDGGLGAQLFGVENVDGSGRLPLGARRVPRPDDDRLFHYIDVVRVGPALAGIFPFFLGGRLLFLRGLLLFPNRRPLRCLLGPGRLPGEKGAGEEECQESRPVQAYQVDRRGCRIRIRSQHGQTVRIVDVE